MIISLHERTEAHVRTYFQRTQDVEIRAMLPSAAETVEDALAMFRRAQEPGASEHQIGLAFDIVSNNYTALDEGFGETEAGIWLAENSYRFGFILRYPQGKEYITGIDYEPWHFRYVGVEAATYITKKGTEAW